MLAHQFGRMRSAGSERGDNAGSACKALFGRVPQSYRNIAQPAFMPDTADRATLHALIELFLGPGD